MWIPWGLILFKSTWWKTVVSLWRLISSHNTVCSHQLLQGCSPTLPSGVLPLEFFIIHVRSGFSEEWADWTYSYSCDISEQHCTTNLLWPKISNVSFGLVAMDTEESTQKVVVALIFLLQMQHIHVYIFPLCLLLGHVLTYLQAIHQVSHLITQTWPDRCTWPGHQRRRSTPWWRRLPGSRGWSHPDQSQ